MMAGIERAVPVGHQFVYDDVESVVACVPWCAVLSSRFTNFVEIDVSGLNVARAGRGLRNPERGAA
jgi:hypothetical protein